MTRKLHNPNLSGVAKNLRKNLTKEERKLWYEFLRSLPVNFKRQKIVGKYIVDFYCAAAKIVIELDGSQHYEEEGLTYDKERDEYLKSLGLTVIRYSNLEINTHFECVCQDILIKLGVEVE